MEWKDYILKLLNESKEFDGIELSLDGGKSREPVSPFVKANIALLDKMIEHKGNRNLFVLPEREKSVLVFSIMKLYHNIIGGKIQANYDLSSFSLGDKLMVGKAVVEFKGFEENEGKQYLKIRLKDADTFRVPIGSLPIFQRTTKSKISSKGTYEKEKKKVLQNASNSGTSFADLAYVESIKTHCISSIFMVTPVASARDKLSDCKIQGRDITEIFYFAYTDYQGMIYNISTGRLEGSPEMIFSPDLYSVISAVEHGQHPQSVIIDCNNFNSLLGQLDCLDIILGWNIPVLCIIDTVDSFDLQALTNRRFNLWRWDSGNLSERLCGQASGIDAGIRNCMNRAVEFVEVKDNNISLPMELLHKHSIELEKQSPAMAKIFDIISSLEFGVLRKTDSFSEDEVSKATGDLLCAECCLKGEKQYVSQQTFNDYNEVITHLSEVCSSGYKLKKAEAIEEYIRKHKGERKVLIVPEKAPKVKIQREWNQWRLQNKITDALFVMYPSEYYDQPADCDSTTIVCGWFRAAVMKKIIFSCITRKYVVLLYDCEKKWAGGTVKEWNKLMNSSGNKEIIDKFCDSGPSIAAPKGEQIVYSGSSGGDDLEKFESLLKENKYRQYTLSGTQSDTDIIKAVPVNFYGDWLAFYSLGHKVISVTNLMLHGGRTIEVKMVSDLKTDDFIVVRETDKDIVREIADNILNDDGKSNLRDISSEWRTAVKEKYSTESVEQFYQQMLQAGCRKSLPTIKRWIEDEDCIAPRDREDLHFLAMVVNDETLTERENIVFNAAKEVRSAHVEAGRILSEKLKKQLSTELARFTGGEAQGMWAPVDIEIEGVGSAKVLRIADISPETNVAVTNVNRLINEE